MNSERHSLTSTRAEAVRIPLRPSRTDAAHVVVDLCAGRLDPKEFRSSLIACGYNIREDRQGDVDFQRIMANVDPTQTGYVTFESFLDFMTRECSEEDNVDQLTLAFKTLSGDKVSCLRARLTHRVLFVSSSRTSQLNFFNANCRPSKPNGACRE